MGAISLRVECPRCKAHVGEMCAKRGGGFHVDRTRAAVAEFRTDLWRCGVHGLVSHVFDDTEDVWVHELERHSTTVVRCNVHQPSLTPGYESEACGWQVTGPFRATLDERPAPPIREAASNAADC
jgi:hypothetical protein